MNLDRYHGSIQFQRIPTCLFVLSASAIEILDMYSVAIKSEGCENEYIQYDRRICGL